MRRLRDKIFIGIILLVIFVLCVNLSWFYITIKKELYDIDLRRIKKALHAVEKEFKFFMRRTRELSASLASRIFFIRCLDEYSNAKVLVEQLRARANLISELSNFMKLRRFMNVTTVKFFSNSGELVFDIRDIKSFGQKSKLLYVIKKEKITTILSHNDSLEIVSITPMYFQKKIVGIAVVGMEINNSLVNRLKEMTGVELILFKYHRNRRQLLLSTLRHIPHNILKKVVKSMEASGNFDNRILNLNKSSYIFGIIPLMAKKEIIGEFWGLIPNLRFALLIRKMLHYILIVFSISILLSALIGYILAKNITNPLKKLVNGTTELARGNFDFNIVVESKDELYTLANAFNKMKDELKIAQQNLININRSLKQEINIVHNELKVLKEQVFDLEKLASIGLMIAGIVHELNSPLTTLSGAAKFLKKDIKEDKKHLKYLDTMLEEISRLKEMSRSILDFSRKDNYIFQKVNFKMMVNNIVSLITPVLKATKVILKLEYRTDIELIKCYPGKLKQLLFNLIMNSIDALAEKGIGLIKLIIESNKEYLIIKVIDNGIGIKKEDQSKIFEPFFTTKPQGKGTGLGLSIVKRIVEEHNGEITFESAVGKGTCFIVKIPLT